MPNRASFLSPAYPALPNIVAMKLFLRPIFCAFCARLSIVLISVGIGGMGGVSRSLRFGVEVEDSSCGGSCAFLRLRNDFMLCLRFCLVVVFDRLRCRLTLASAVSFSNSSISCPMVFPSVAMFSSAIAQNLIKPRSGQTPKPSSMAFASNAALRLLVTGCNCDGKALIVRVYAGSKLPPKSKQHECATVTTMELSGRW